MATWKPQTEAIFLLASVTPDYAHTILFSNPAQQEQYFKSLAVVTLENLSYQRPTLGSIMVENPAREILTANYLMFRNKDYGEQWYYCFIDSVVYENDHCTIVNYTIDVIQTWLFKFELRECLVLREHSYEDYVGDNILPEPVETGEMVYLNYSDLTQLSDLAIIVGEIEPGAGQFEVGNMYNGVFSGLKLRAYIPGNALAVKIESFAERPENLVCMVPKRALNVTDAALLLGYPIPESQRAAKQRFNGPRIQPTLAENYQPKNYKLYTYPYNYLYVTNNQGGSLTYRYEFGSDHEFPVFELYCTVSQPVGCVLRPINYKMPDRNIPLTTETLTLSDFPLCSWKNTSYETWQAQNKFENNVNLIESAVAGGLQIASKRPTQIIAGTKKIYDAVSDYIQADYRASIASDNISGTASGGSINVAAGTMTYYAGQMSVTPQYAKRIDDFFTMFGYACEQIKVPSLKNRSRFTYVKTAGCVVVGRLPSDAAKQIMNAFDNGITWWQPTSAMFDYQTENAPLGGQGF